MGRVDRVTGLCSVVGGAAWVAGCLVHNSLPQGCIDAGCTDGAVMRGSSPAEVALLVMAGLLLAVSSLGLLVLARTARGGDLGRPGAASGVAGGAGLLLLGAAGIVAAFDGNWSGMPGLVVPGVLFLALGLALLAWVVFRAGVLPTWLCALLLATVLVLPFANEQTSRILLAVPFGLAWMVTGVVVAARRPQTVMADSR